MPRYKLTLEYDGTPFAGWQKVADLPSVQSRLEEAIADFCGEPAQVVGAGRTDAGVHAKGQVAHVDLAKEHDPHTVMSALNAHLLEPERKGYERVHHICVLAAERVADDFHARFSATKRHYLYRILNRRAPAAIDANRVWHVPEPLDAPAMHDAAQCLVGHHDFSTFRDSRCQAKSPEKTLELLEVSRTGEEILIRVSGRSFLHHQVRNITGTLKMVGMGKWTAQDVAQALAARDRRAGGPTAPADGLCLTGVEY